VRDTPSLSGFSITLLDYYFDWEEIEKRILEEKNNDEKV
jgi:hypothetical protein